MGLMAVKSARDGEGDSARKGRGQGRPENKCKGSSPMLLIYPGITRERWGSWAPGPAPRAGERGSKSGKKKKIPGKDKERGAFPERMKKRWQKSKRKKKKTTTVCSEEPPPQSR